MKTIEEKILEMYKKDTFTTADSEFIGNAIENFDIYTDELTKILVMVVLIRKIMMN
jgi:hypothetical protein